MDCLGAAGCLCRGPLGRVQREEQLLSMARARGLDHWDEQMQVLASEMGAWCSHDCWGQFFLSYVVVLGIGLKVQSFPGQLVLVAI